MSDWSTGGIERSQINVDTLDFDGSATHECPIEGEVTRHYYDCPNCDTPLCEWMDCPECGWYDEDAWDRTLNAEIDRSGGEADV